MESKLKAYHLLHALEMRRSYLRFKCYRGMLFAVQNFADRFIGPYDVSKMMLWIGWNKFGQTMRGTTPNSIRRIIRELTRRGLLVGRIDEFKTTYGCSGCCGTGCKHVIWDFKSGALDTVIDIRKPFSWDLAINKETNRFNIVEAGRTNCSSLLPFAV